MSRDHGMNAAAILPKSLPKFLKLKNIELTLIRDERRRVH